MELYGRILCVAMPIFLLLVLLEKAYGTFIGQDKVRTMDMVSSLSSGMTNVVKDVLGLSVSILSYEWLLRHCALFEMPSTAWTFLISVVVLDFEGYWVHRWSHKINFFWNKHAIHHSSEEYNLACALRQSVSSFVNLFTFFLLPAAILGVPASVIAIVAPIQLFAQFWYHTQHIGRMGFLENIIVTPSHHRVHHALNPEYMDKNLSQIFIIWDKLFGTFQEELPEVPPVYGITHPAATWNPIKINFQHIFLLAQDAWHTKSWRDKLRLWWMPTGWRPSDVAERFPVQKIQNIYSFEKYAPKTSRLLLFWSCFQMTVTFLFVYFFFGHLAVIGSPSIFYYGLFIFASVYSYTDLMDKNRSALVSETLRSAIALSMLYFNGDWFGFSNSIAQSNILIFFYFALSFAATAYFVFFEFKVEQKNELRYETNMVQ